MPDAPDPPRWWLCLAEMPDPAGVPGAVRVRRLLKRLMRDYRLRCVDLRSHPPEEVRRDARTD